MYPHPLHVFGFEASVWNAAFLLAVAGGYLVFRASVRAQRRLSLPALRYLLVVYLSALAAQVFAYAIDATTALVPPPSVSLWAWYLSPVVGPKTLYGVIVLMPFSVAIATAGCRLSLAEALDLWTPAMLVVLATSRLGCFLQGCCYGARSDVFGISFPHGSPAYFKQITEGILSDGPASLPVVPTQALEAVFLAMLAAWMWQRHGHVRPLGLFVPAVVWYSIFRFTIEFVRADVERGFYGPLATSQWISLILLGAVSVFLVARSARGQALFTDRLPR